MAARKKDIIWSKEELDDWMELKTITVVFMKEINGETIKNKEQHEIGNFKSKKGSTVSIQKGGKTRKVGYTSIMISKLHKLLGDRQLISFKPFLISSTNRKTANITSYYRCPHKNSVAVSCLWTSFRPGADLKFSVSWSNCEACTGIMEADSIFNSEDDNDKPECSKQNKLATRKPVFASNCNDSSTEKIMRAAASTSVNLENPNIQINTIDRSLYNELQRTTGQLIFNWYNSLPSRSVNLPMFESMMNEIHTLGYNVQRSIIYTAEKMKQQTTEPLKEMLKTVKKIQSSTCSDEKQHETISTIFESETVSQTNGGSLFTKNSACENLEQKSVIANQSALVISNIVDIEKLPTCISKVIQEMQNNPNDNMSTITPHGNNETGSAENQNSQQELLVTTDKSDQVKKVKVVSHRKKHAPKVDSSAIIEGKRRRLCNETDRES